jgi:hypothetical protein
MRDSSLIVQKPHYFGEMSTAPGMPEFADGPGVTVPTEVPFRSGVYDITLTSIYDGRVWKCGYSSGVWGGWELVKGREFARQFAGDDALALDLYVPFFGDVIDDLTTIANIPSGVTGMGLLSDKEIPTSSGKHLRSLNCLDLGSAFWNYYNGSSWTGWVSSGDAEVGGGMDVYASADSAGIGTTPVAVPFDVVDYQHGILDATLGSSVITINEDIPALRAEYDITSYLSMGVAASITHKVYQAGSAVNRSASSSYASQVGLTAAVAAFGSCVLSVASGDTVGVSSFSSNALSTFNTVGNSCRIRLTRMPS